jgi:two-component system CheB/CheR fusion protein
MASLDSVGVAAGSAEEQRGSAANEPGDEGSQRRILIVDDNIDAAESLNVLLGLEEYETRVVSDGRAALEAISAGYQPDFVLLDIGLPDLSGYEVAQFIRASQSSSIKIIALTGFGGAKDLIRSHESGFDAHLVKPIDYEALMKILAADIGAS